MTKRKRVLAERPPDSILMWAYGANLNQRGMRERCPNAVKYGPLVLPHGQLVFRMVADVEYSRDPEHRIAGGLWWVTPRCVAALDRFEGVANGFYAKKYLKLRVRGKVMPCLFYKREGERGIMPPPETYYDTIAEGYEYFGLDKNLLLDACARAWADKDRTPSLMERYERKGRPKLSRHLAAEGIDLT